MLNYQKRSTVYFAPYVWRLQPIPPCVPIIARKRMVAGNPLTSNMDVICDLANFVEDAQYLYFAAVSRKFKAAWGKRPTETSIVNRTTSAAQLQYSFKCGVDPRAALVFEVRRLPSKVWPRFRKGHGLGTSDLYHMRYGLTLTDKMIRISRGADRVRSGIHGTVRFLLCFDCDSMCGTFVVCLFWCIIQTELCSDC